MWKKLAVALAVGLVLLSIACLWLGRVESCASCVDLNTEFCISKNQQSHGVTTTIRQQLRWHGAYCRDGIICDWRGREIRFHGMLEQYGARVSDNQRQQREKDIEADEAAVRQLGATFTVIRMYRTKPPAQSLPKNMTCQCDTLNRANSAIILRNPQLAAKPPGLSAHLYN